METPVASTAEMTLNNKTGRREQGFEDNYYRVLYDKKALIKYLEKRLEKS